MQKTEIVKLSWKKFGEIILRMTKEIQVDFELNVIVGVGKSGIIPASILAKRLGIIEFYSIVVSLYNEEKPPRKLYQEPQIMFSSLGSLEGKKVLVVDDFAHTGATLKKVLQKVANAGAKEVISAKLRQPDRISNVPVRSLYDDRSECAHPVHLLQQFFRCPIFNGNIGSDDIKL